MHFRFVLRRIPLNPISSFRSKKHLQKVASVYLNNQIQVHQKETIPDKTTQDLADEILFKKLLQREIRIMLYNHSRNWQILRYLMLFMVCGFTLFFCHRISRYNELDVLWRFTALIIQVVLPILVCQFYYRWTKSFVAKVVYNSKTRVFEIDKYGVLFPIRKTQFVAAKSIMYTDDRILHNEFVNYINLETLETYFIGKPSGWVNMKLFSYLIKQNVKSRIHAFRKEGN